MATVAVHSHPPKLTSPLVALHSDANQATARAYSVSAMPTFVFIKNKSVIETIRGADKNKLTAAVQKHSAESTSNSSFAGKGNTLSGGSVSGSASSFSSRPSSAASAAASPFQGVSRDNMLPLLVLGAYVVYLLFLKD